MCSRSDGGTADGTGWPSARSSVVSSGKLSSHERHVFKFSGAASGSIGRSFWPAARFRRAFAANASSSAFRFAAFAFFASSSSSSGAGSSAPLYAFGVRSRNLRSAPSGAPADGESMSSGTATSEGGAAA